MTEGEGRTSLGQICVTSFINGLSGKSQCLCVCVHVNGSKQALLKYFVLETSLIVVKSCSCDIDLMFQVS